MRSALLVALPLVALAAPASDPVRDVLYARDTKVPDAAGWRRLGPDVEQRLATFALDGSVILGARARAVAGLEALAGPIALITLRSLLASPQTPPELLAAAIQSYANAAPTKDTADVVARARALLDHPDPLLRKAAARALGRTKSPDAAAPLRARIAVEPRRDVKVQLQKSLHAIEVAKLPR